MPHLDTLAYTHILSTFWTLILSLFFWNNNILFLFLNRSSLYKHINSNLNDSNNQFFYNYS